MGYEVHHHILNALDFGIPQSRKRLWIIGTKGKGFSFPVGDTKTPPLASLLDKDVAENVIALVKFLAKPKVS